MTGRKTLSADPQSKPFSGVYPDYHRERDIKRTCLSKGAGHRDRTPDHRFRTSFRHRGRLPDPAARSPDPITSKDPESRDQAEIFSCSGL
jgi:hypothetical protein